LTLDSTSSAKVERLSYNGNNVFGPDSSIPGNTNQIQLGSITGQSTLQLNAAYIRTGAITPGSVSAAATFTFSYQ
jgi:type 1 fimbria pilin